MASNLCFRIVVLILSFIFSVSAFADGSDHGSSESHEGEGGTYTDYVLHHIGDANEFHIAGDLSIPLPLILYDIDRGIFVTGMSSVFEHGHNSYKGYVMHHGNVMKVKGDFPIDRSVHVGNIYDKEVDGVSKSFVEYKGHTYELEDAASVLNMTGFIDFSISKVVFTMLLAGLLLFIIFRAVRNTAEKNEGKAPSGIQSFIEPIIVFLRDEVAKPSLGDKWEQFFPYIATLFFFIAINNLIGLVPIFPGSGNTMGHLGVTLALALMTFIVTSIKGNKHYWEHILWMPGVPWPVKLLLTPIEIIGMFTKPFTLMIRLFANISAGHIIILSLVGIIFLLSNNGLSVGGGIGGMVIAVPFLIAMNFLEIFVALLQAFIFALLSALYIGSAVEEHH